MLSLKILLFFITVNCIINPQSGSIKGVVKTSAGSPVELVNIVLNGTGKGTVTNKDGEYEIKDINPGSYKLIISFVGYERIETDAEVKSGSTTMVPDIILKETARILGEVIIRDSKNKFGNTESDYISRLPVRNMENPQSYSTTTPQLLNEQNIISYTSAIQSIPGGVVSSNDPAGITGLFVRGFLTRTYIRNGLYTLSHNGGDLQNVERLEIIKGPSGSIYGTSGVAYGGLINKVTKKPFAEKFINAGLTFGSFNLQRFTGDLNIPFNDEKTFLFRLNTVAHYEGSFQDYGFKRNYFFAPVFYYKLSDNMELLVDAEINNIDYSSPSWFLGAPSLGISRIDEIKRDYNKSYISGNLDSEPTQLNNYNGQLNYYFSKNWKLSTNIALADINLNGSNMIPRFINDSLLIRRLYDYNGQYNTINFQPYVTGDFLIGDFRNRLIMGIDYKWAEFHVSQFFNLNIDTINYTRDAVPVLNVNRARMNYNLSVIELFTASSTAVYFSDFFSINDQLNLMLGLRFEQIKNEGTDNLVTGAVVTKPFDQTAFSPQAGISYEILENELSLFANYMKGFDFVPPNNQGQNFKPESGVQLEGGIKLDLFNGIISSTISYYNIEVEDKIRPDVNNPPFSIQDGTQLSRGVDIDLRLAPFPGLNMIAGYVYNESEFTKAAAGIEGNRPVGTPWHIANLWGSYSFNSGIFNGFGFGAGFTFSDEYYYDDANTLIIPYYMIYRGSIFYNTSKFRVTLTGENLTDEKYWNYIGTPQLPARVLASINFTID